MLGGWTSSEKSLESHDSLITDGAQQAKKSPPATPAFKKRHRGCSYCILDLDNAPLPVFPPNEVVVGVITMEDVIEELLQVRCFNALYLELVVWAPNYLVLYVFVLILFLVLMVQL